MKNIEDDILNSLAKSDGNILDDQGLIVKLDESKVTSAVI